MDNVYSFKYFKELNQKSILDETFIEKSRLNLEEMKGIFYKYVERVSPSSEDSATHIGISLTNTLLNSVHTISQDTLRHHFNFLFWPIYGEVGYSFKKGNFFINLGRDPIEISDSAGPCSSFNHKFFFPKNPFRNTEFYKNKFGFWLPEVYEDIKETSEMKFVTARIKGKSRKEAYRVMFS